MSWVATVGASIGVGPMHDVYDAIDTLARIAEPRRVVAQRAKGNVVRYGRQKYVVCLKYQTTASSARRAGGASPTRST